jgi:hypothetical protein
MLRERSFVFGRLFVSLGRHAIELAAASGVPLNGLCLHEVRGTIRYSNATAFVANVWLRECAASWDPNRKAWFSRSLHCSCP